MTTNIQRHDHGRAAKATVLIATLMDQLPAAHPARTTARELQALFAPSLEAVRAAIDKVPGRSLAKKAERIGIPRGSVWALWHGRYQPAPEILQRMHDASMETADVE